MVASKPLPPIPPVSEKVTERVAEKLDKTDKRASHAFPSLSSLSSLSTLANLNLNLNLRRRNDAPSVLTDSKASTPAHSRPSTPQPPSSTGTTTTTIAAAQPGDVASALVTTPTVVKHGLVLDHRSLQHLRAIARQSISSSCLEPEILWLRLFMDMIQRLSVNVSDAWQQIEASYESTSERISAEQDTSLDGHADDAPENNNNNKKKKNIKEPLIVAVAAATSTATAPVMDHKDQASRNTPSFSYSIQLVKRVSSSQECTFTPGRFEGESILLEERSVTDRKRHNKKEEPIQIQLGGTVSLSAGAEDLPKAEKILELLVFALCSLQLEMYLLKDHHVVRQDPGIVSDSTLKPLAQQNPLTNSKRASKGSMFFGWLSRGTLPAKYKKGTTQLTQDPDTTPTNSRHGQGAYAGDDLSFGEDHNNHSYR
ncbi:hypothetical protein BGZ52_003392, partial [Haplosporangium bisporale]